jgi:ATP-dependent Clp protease adaptor protein ClpS
MPTTIERPDTIELPPIKPDFTPSHLGMPGLDELSDIRLGFDLTGPWIVILYNDDWHSVDEVIDIVQQATGCSLDDAVTITYRVHNEGRAICFSGSKEECDKVAAIIATIRLQVETDRA